LRTGFDLAASAASIIAIGADRRIMAPGTLLMIHNPWSMAGGNADDLRKEADVLDVIASEMSKLYAEASGGKLSAEAITKVGGILAQRGHISATTVGNGPGKGGWHWEYALLSMPDEPPSRIWDADQPVRREVRKPMQGNCLYEQPQCLLAQVWRTRIV
jgi:hypothetical protein